MADAHKEQQKFRILDLPAELRLRIYEYVLKEQDTISILYINRTISPGVYKMEFVRPGHRRDKHHRGVIWDRRSRGWVPAPPSPTALLLVNKQINAEATKVLYGSNRFKFADLFCLREFIELLGDRAQWFQHIELSISQNASWTYTWGNVRNVRG
ncbi:hypothetical protein CLAFUW4_09474 [Fulvia fulva]|uniref:DUF7730 domain-containing protein n=1 Tax=Passalora fulva TaxID=5499 RepID=A0A9Q8UTW1_PASFU|nr:uncharacterized protein CLAFUR5_09571 [Fulvia fulva]KAK4614061.1 hypothetical protein CLAFUR4_09480 [Fulvia fulva]KAK4615236.1 hypothetical protein CLAFUR0_09471 [Fulvia fulva]UJO22329.1 hypothetical protein CLAFUR5_09571 [Fulvia fulva]WPV20014.1 hypothetical protein CLAFUW4_09474 [Fulvia fulva]WPV35133.1 hypothetical protein CLAFUW7_09475 [Fulvia fulva]